MLRHTRALGIVLALLTGTFWGVGAPIIKTLAQEGISMVTVIFLRTLFVSVLMGLWVFFSESARGFRITGREHRFFLVMGILNALFTATGFFFSIKYLPISTALLLHYLFPMVTIGGEWIFFHQTPSKGRVLAAFLILFGLWVGVAQISLSQDIQATLLGFLWGILAIVGLAGQSLLGKVMARDKKSSYKVVLFYTHLYGALLLGIFKTCIVGMGDIPKIPLQSLGLILFLGFTGGALAYGAYYLSLQFISASLGSLLCTSEILVGMLGSALFVGVPPMLNELAGAVIIIFAIGLAVYT